MVPKGAFQKVKTSYTKVKAFRVEERRGKRKFESEARVGGRPYEN